jgi:hypothetical protein
MTKLWWRLAEEELDAQADTAREEAKASSALAARKQPQEQKRSQERAAA